MLQVEDGDDMLADFKASGVCVCARACVCVCVCVCACACVCVCVESCVMQPSPSAGVICMIVALSRS